MPTLPYTIKYMQSDLSKWLNIRWFCLNLCSFSDWANSFKSALSSTSTYYMNLRFSNNPNISSNLSYSRLFGSLDNSRIKSVCLKRFISTFVKTSVTRVTFALIRSIYMSFSNSSLILTHCFWSSESKYAFKSTCSMTSPFKLYGWRRICSGAVRFGFSSSSNVVAWGGKNIWLIK